MEIEDFFFCLGNLVGSFLGAEDYGKNYLGMKKKKHITQALHFISNNISRSFICILCKLHANEKVPKLISTQGKQPENSYPKCIFYKPYGIIQF